MSRSDNTLPWKVLPQYERGCNHGGQNSMGGNAKEHKQSQHRTYRRRDNVELHMAAREGVHFDCSQMWTKIHPWDKV